MVKKQKVQSINLAPQLTRVWQIVELRPRDKKNVNSPKVKKFQKRLAKICGMHVFCGPMIIAPDTKDKLNPYYTNQEFKPRDWNAYTWWTQPDASNVVSILDKSHTVFYYYPDHNLINITIASCKKFDPKIIVKFIYDYWQPDKKGIRYSVISPSKKSNQWINYP